MSRVLVTVLLGLFLQSVSSSNRCWVKTSNIFFDDQEEHFTCPRKDDPPHFTDCCGPSWDRRCCASFMDDLDDVDFEDLYDSTKYAVGVVITVVITLVTVSMIC